MFYKVVDKNFNGVKRNSKNSGNLIYKVGTFVYNTGGVFSWVFTDLDSAQKFLSKLDKSCKIYECEIEGRCDNPVMDKLIHDLKNITYAYGIKLTNEVAKQTANSGDIISFNGHEHIVSAVSVENSNNKCMWNILDKTGHNIIYPIINENYNCISIKEIRDSLSKLGKNMSNIQILGKCAGFEKD